MRPFIPQFPLCLVLLAFVMVLVTPAPAKAQSEISVNSSVNRNTIGTEETLMYTVEIRSDSPISNLYQPEPPTVRNLNLLQPTPSTTQSSVFSSATGKMEQSISFTWYLRAAEPGDASIGRTTVVVGQKTYATAPISVRVTGEPRSSTAPRTNSPPSARPRGRSMFDNPFVDPVDPEPETGEFTGEDFFIRAFPAKRRAYQNEQVAVDYYLYVKRGVEIRNSRLADSWDAEGFWREEMEVDHDTEVEVMNGIAYRKILLKRIVIFPTRAGTLKIDPLEIEGDASRTRTGTPFGTYLRRPSLDTDAVTIKSPAVTITGVALPANSPAAFSGAVGKFDLSVDVDKTDLDVGETVSLTVTIAGRGNVATLSPPLIELPTMLERYDPVVDDRVNRVGSTVNGSKTFRYTIIPRSNGSYQIPAIQYAYFDPAAGTYVTLSSDPYTLTVSGSAEPVSATLSSNFPANDVAGIVTSIGTWRSISDKRLYETWWPPILLLIPVFLLAGLVFYRKHVDRLETDTDFARSREAVSTSHKHLKQASRLLTTSSAPDFYEEIANALLSFLGNRMNVAERGLTQPQLDGLLSDRMVPEELRMSVFSMLNECDRVRYAPVTPGMAQMKQTLDRAGVILSELEPFLPKLKSRS